jgi:hypothetical protein
VEIGGLLGRSESGIAIVVFALMGGSTVVLADPIGFTSLVTASASVLSQSSFQSDPISAQAFVSTPIIVNGLYGGNLTGTAEATAEVGFGVIVLSAMDTVASSTDNGSGGFASRAQATASGSFEDTITILGGTGTANLVWRLLDGGTITPIFDFPTQITFGVPFDISAASTIGSAGNLFTGADMASSFFGVDGLSVNGNFSNYQYSTGSNSAYFLSGTFVSTPEPASWGLCTFGMAFLAVRARSHRRSRKGST